MSINECVGGGLKSYYGLGYRNDLLAMRECLYRKNARAEYNPRNVSHRKVYRGGIAPDFLWAISLQHVSNFLETMRLLL